MAFKTLSSLLIISSLSLSCDSGSSAKNAPVKPTENTKPTPVMADENFGICTELDFTGITWPGSMDFADRKTMALSLNITGSYEGQDGWANITNNFDGQGMSLGLLQQNLGQGSLQPLLLDMRNDHMDVLESLFSEDQLDSLLEMVNQWEDAVDGSSFLGSDLFPNKEALSELDFDSSIHQKLTDENQAGVDWAVATVFKSDKKTFKPEWSKAFIALATTPEYRSLQVQRAFEIYSSAVRYFQYFKFHEVRSMILMYDYVTQNGGFNSVHKANYDAWLKTHAQSGDAEKAAALLEIRIVSVRPQFIQDVRDRKGVIMSGVGVVHETDRNFPKEYCFDPYQQL